VLGVPKMDPVASFPDLGGALDAVWTNVEVPADMFEDFGHMGSRALDSLVAA
jgi:hypothetical protein